MTRDEIVQIAQDVGLFMRSHKFQDEPTKLEQFAERIAAAEREACAKIADKCIEDSEKVTPESEQEENYMVAMRILSEEFAIAIRARGET